MDASFKGKFIVLDGPDGCGKSTQARLLAEWVRESGIEVVSFRDPGTTEIGEEIRHILLNPANAAMGTATDSPTPACFHRGRYSSFGWLSWFPQPSLI